MGVSARILADSYCEQPLTGMTRVTTMEVVMHRFVLAEFNTHRVFSRNSASSRAIPFPKMLDRVLMDPAIPLVFPAEQKGMQGGDEIADVVEARNEWRIARDYAVSAAQRLAEMGVHKSICNRLLEPFMWHTVVVTSTEWDNFFKQRCSPLAQPEIRAAAECMEHALQTSTPVKLNSGEWHLPLIQADEHDLPLWQQIKVSAARCARTSYLTHHGERDVAEDLAMYGRLISADPGHWSPLEHVCTPSNFFYEGALGNLVGFTQLRHVVEEKRELVDRLGNRSATLTALVRTLRTA